MGRASGPRAVRLPGRFQTTGRGRRETARPLHTRGGEDAAGAGSGSGPAWEPPETCSTLSTRVPRLVTAARSEHSGSVPRQRAGSTAARVSRVGTSPQQATTTSGSSPRSLQAPPHMPSPAAPFDMCVLNDVDPSWSSSSSAEIGESRLNDVLNHRNDDRRRHTEQDHSTGGFERSEESP
jgi:hypothetical protein